MRVGLAQCARDPCAAERVIPVEHNRGSDASTQVPATHGCDGARAVGMPKRWQHAGARAIGCAVDLGQPSTAPEQPGLETAPYRAGCIYSGREASSQDRNTRRVI